MKKSEALSTEKLIEQDLPKELDQEIMETRPFWFRHYSNSSVFKWNNYK